MGWPWDTERNCKLWVAIEWCAGERGARQERWSATTLCFPVYTAGERAMAEKTETKEAEGSKRLVALDTGIGGMPFGKDEVLSPDQARLKIEALRHFQQAYKAQERRD